MASTAVNIFTITRIKESKTRPPTTNTQVGRNKIRLPVTLNAVRCADVQIMFIYMLTCDTFTFAIVHHNHVGFSEFSEGPNPPILEFRLESFNP
jgi:hypothetical protein